MLINPKKAIEEGWVTWNDNVTDITKYIQPNALDFDCAKIYELDMSSTGILSEQTKRICRSSELATDPNHNWPGMEGEFWHLHRGRCYDFMSNFHVTIPEGVAALLIIRSTLNRSGVFLTSGIFDSGYSGNIAGMLRVGAGDFRLAPNTRIGQIMFIESDSAGLYTGGYNHAAGTHWADPKSTH